MTDDPFKVCVYTPILVTRYSYFTISVNSSPPLTLQQGRTEGEMVLCDICKTKVFYAGTQPNPTTAGYKCIDTITCYARANPDGKRQRKPKDRMD